MASWRSEDLTGWSRPDFNREDSVRHIAPGLMARERPSPHDPLYLSTPTEFHSASDDNNWPLKNEPIKHEPDNSRKGGGYDYLANGLDNNNSHDYQIETREPRRRRFQFTRKRMLILLAIVILIIIIAIVVPVAVVETRKSQASPSAPDGSPGQSPSTPDGSQPSGGAAPASGAIKDSGIGSAEFGDPSLVFFQHADGAIWQTSARGDGQSFKGKVWDGNDIREGTPISAVQYQASNRNVTHVAFIGKDNILRDAVQYNGTGAWEHGRLQVANFEASSSARVGLALVALQTDNKEQTTYPLGAIRVYYGGSDGLIHEASISGASSPECLTEMCIDIQPVVWQSKHTFPNGFNGNAGLAVAQPEDNSYLICANADNKLVYWHMQTYPSDQGDWTGGPAAVGATLGQNASVALAGGSMAFFQDENNEVKGIDFDPKSDLDHAWGDIHNVAKGAANTRLSGMLVNNDSTPAVIFEAENNAVTQYVRDGNGWKTSDVPVN